MLAKEEQVKKRQEEGQADMEHHRQERMASLEATRARIEEITVEFGRHTEEGFANMESQFKLAMDQASQAGENKRHQAAERNRKRDAMFVRCSEQEQVRTDSRQAELQEVIADKQRRACVGSEEQQKVCSQSMARARRKTLWRELAAENRTHVRRGRQFRRECTMSRIIGEIDFMDRAEEEQARFRQQRLVVSKQVWMQKEACTEIVEKLSSANSRSQFVKLCEQFGVDAKEPRPPVRSASSGMSFGADGGNGEESRPLGRAVSSLF